MQPQRRKHAPENPQPRRTSLIGFHHPNRYGDAILKPIRKVRENDIVREWDECRHIFVSLARKETTQSTIVRKLSSLTSFSENDKVTPGAVAAISF